MELASVENSLRAGRELLLGAGTFIGSLGLLVLRFLVPVPIGLTDNGDGWRLTCQVGAFEGGRQGHQFVQFAYHGGDECGHVDYVASQVWLARIAQWIGDVIGTESVLNLLILGLVGSVLAAAGVTTVVLGLPLAFRYRVLAGALMLLLIADSAFFPYLAAVTTEGPAFLGILLTVGGLLLMHREGGWRYAGGSVVALGGILAINAKVQTLTIWPFLVLAVLLVYRPGRTRLARWALPVAVLMAVTGVTTFLHGTMNRGESFPATAHMNMYHTIFNSIVDGHHDTEADLVDLGLPPSFARYVGTRVWGPNSAGNDPLYPEYVNRFSRANVARYYLTHPKRTVEILDRSASDLMLTRADYQGNFAEEAGYPPVTKEHRVPVISGLLGLIAPLGLFFLLPLWMVLGWAAVRAARSGRREIAVVVFFVLAVALGQFLAAALGEGIENVKHQVVAAFCTALAGLLVLIGLLPRRPWQVPDSELEPAEEAVLETAAR